VKRGLLGGAGFVGLAVVVAATWVVLSGASSGETQTTVREVVLEARDLAFNVDNPTIEALPGERLRIVVRNTDPGVVHSITIPGLMEDVVRVEYGRQVSFQVTIPESGRFEYICPQHAPRMKGELVVNGR
jgi:plastocyanin